jgi:hypothetical protein
MPRGGPRRRGHKCRGCYLVMQAQYGAEESEGVFRSQTPPETKVEMELIEEEA